MGSAAIRLPGSCSSCFEKPDSKISSWLHQTISGSTSQRQSLVPEQTGAIDEIVSFMRPANVAFNARLFYCCLGSVSFGNYLLFSELILLLQSFIVFLACLTGFKSSKYFVIISTRFANGSSPCKLKEIPVLHLREAIVIIVNLDTGDLMMDLYLEPVRLDYPKASKTTSLCYRWGQCSRSHEIRCYWYLYYHITHLPGPSKPNFSVSRSSPIQKYLRSSFRSQEDQTITAPSSHFSLFRVFLANVFGKSLYPHHTLPFAQLLLC